MRPAPLLLTLCLATAVVAAVEAPRAAAALLEIGQIVREQFWDPKLSGVHRRAAVDRAAQEPSQAGPRQEAIVEAGARALAGLLAEAAH